MWNKQTGAKRLLLTALYTAYVFAVYTWLIVPAFAEYSVYALLLVPVVIGLAWLVPAAERRTTFVFTLGIVLAVEAVSRTQYLSLGAMLVSTAVIILVIGGISAYYGRVQSSVMLAMLAVVIGVSWALPVGKLEMYAHFKLVDRTEQTYQGEFTQPFPFRIADLNLDGRNEIVTIGNTVIRGLSTKEARAYRDAMYAVETKELPMQALVFSLDYNGGLRAAVDPAGMTFDTGMIRGALPRFYTGAYPYYLWNSSSMSLKKVFSSDLFTAAMLRTGASPALMYTLDLAWTQNQVIDQDGVWDAIDEAGGYRDLVLRAGELTGKTPDGGVFTWPTSASRIIGSMRIADGREVLVLQGVQVDLVDPGRNERVASLSKYDKMGIGKSDISIGDLNANGIDELIIHYPQPLIIEPGTDGTWNVLYGSRSEQFALLDVDGRDMIGVERSVVRKSETMYLTGYRYGDASLHTKWRVYLPNITQAAYADIDGDGKKEIVTTFDGEHRVYVWKSHGIPVRWLLLGLSAVFVGMLIRRRVRGHVAV